MVFKTFSERKRLESRGGEPEVYVYDKAPQQLRHQIALAFSEGIGRFIEPNRYDATGIPVRYQAANICWREIDRTCHKEIFAYRDYIGTSNPMNRVLNALSISKVSMIF